MSQVKKFTNKKWGGGSVRVALKKKARVLDFEV